MPSSLSYLSASAAQLAHARGCHASVMCIDKHTMEAILSSSNMSFMKILSGQAAQTNTSQFLTCNSVGDSAAPQQAAEVFCPDDVKSCNWVMSIDETILVMSTWFFPGNDSGYISHSQISDGDQDELSQYRV